MNKSKTIIDLSFVKDETNEILQNILDQIYKKREYGELNVSDLLDINDYSPISRFETCFFTQYLIE